MLADAMDYVDTCVSFVLSRLNMLFDVFPGFSALLLMFFTIFTVSRLLIAPLTSAFFSVGASDLVREARDEGAYGKPNKNSKRGGKYASNTSQKKRNARIKRQSRKAAD